MFGLLIFTGTCVGAWYYFSNNKKQSDILDKAEQDLSDAKVARKAANIQNETENVLQEINNIKQKTE